MTGGQLRHPGIARVARTITSLALATALAACGNQTFKLSASGLNCVADRTRGVVCTDSKANNDAPPTAPQSVNVVAIDHGLRVSWETPRNVGGSAITRYVATANPGGASCTTNGSLTCDIVGLTLGSAYTASVVAISANGASPASQESAAVVVVSLPGAPTGVLAEPSATSIKVSWTAPESDGGSPVTEYSVQSLPEGLTCVAGADLFCDIPGAEPGVQYQFFVLAKSAVGISVASALSTPTAVLTAPGAPTAVSVSAGDRTVLVSWNAPESDGGSRITGYEVSADSGGFSCSTSGATACQIDGLRNGTAYTFSVVAVNSIGESAPSETSDPISPTSPGLIAVPSPEVTRVGNTVELTLANVDAGTSVRFTYPGSSPCVVDVDESGTASCSFLVKQPKANAITAVIGRNTVSTLFYVPKVSGPGASVKRGKPFKFSVSGAPPFASVAVSVGNVVVLEDVASSKGAVALSVPTSDAGPVDFSVSISGVEVTSGSIKVV